MTMRDAIERYMRTMRHEGRITSDRTETAYRQVLDHHATDVNNRSPHATNRADCIRTLQRWSKPETMVKRLSVLVSFYRWAVREGIRDANPADQVPRPRVRPAQMYKLTRGEVGAMLKAANGTRERRITYLGFCAGLRSHELRNLQGRHLARPGYIWVSADIGKGGRERWIPIIAELELVAAEIRAHVALEEYILPGSRLISGGGWGTVKAWGDSDQCMSSQTLQRTVKRISKRAGIGAHVHPHLMRHAFLSHIARATGDVGIAQALAGHADISTTQTYLDQRTLDELTEAVRDIRFTDGTDTRRIPNRITPDGDDYAELIQPQTPIGTGIAPDLHKGIRNNPESDNEARRVGYVMRDTSRTHTPGTHHKPTPAHHTPHGEGGIRTPDSNHPPSIGDPSDDA